MERILKKLRFFGRWQWFLCLALLLLRFIVGQQPTGVSGQHPTQKILKEDASTKQESATFIYFCFDDYLITEVIKLFGLALHKARIPKPYQISYWTASFVLSTPSCKRAHPLPPCVFVFNELEGKYLRKVRIELTGAFYQAQYSELMEDYFVCMFSLESK